MRLDENSYQFRALRQRLDVCSEQVTALSTESPSVVDSARLCWTGFSFRAYILERYVWFSAVLHVAVALKRTCVDPIVVTSRNSQCAAAKRVLRILSPRELCTIRVTASCVTLSPSGNSSSFTTPQTLSWVLPERAPLMVIIGFADNTTRFFLPIPTFLSSRLPHTVVLSCILSLQLRQQRVVDVAASKMPTCGSGRTILNEL